MIIPIKCFTCGKVIANKYRWYKEKVAEMKGDPTKQEEVTYLTNKGTKKTIEGKVMDMLSLNICCRRHMLTHVDIL